MHERADRYVTLQSRARRGDDRSDWQSGFTRMPAIGPSSAGAQTVDGPRPSAPADGRPSSSPSRRDRVVGSRARRRAVHARRHQPHSAKPRCSLAVQVRDARARLTPGRHGCSVDRRSSVRPHPHRVGALRWIAHRHQTVIRRKGIASAEIDAPRRPEWARAGAVTRSPETTSPRCRDTALAEVRAHDLQVGWYRPSDGHPRRPAVVVCFVCFV